MFPVYSPREAVSTKIDPRVSAPCALASARHATPTYHLLLRTRLLTWHWDRSYTPISTRSRISHAATVLSNARASTRRHRVERRRHAHSTSTRSPSRTAAYTVYLGVCWVPADTRSARTAAAGCSLGTCRPVGLGVHRHRTCTTSAGDSTTPSSYAGAAASCTASRAQACKTSGRSATAAGSCQDRRSAGESTSASDQRFACERRRRARSRTAHARSGRASRSSATTGSARTCQTRAGSRGQRRR
ncbi:MAG: hypothetical protein RL701_956 [Pseudomonadota bacterium]